MDDIAPAGNVQVFGPPPAGVVATPMPIADLDKKSGGADADVFRSEKYIPSFNRKFDAVIAIAPVSFVTTSTAGAFVESMPMALNFFFSIGLLFETTVMLDPSAVPL